MPWACRTLSVGSGGEEKNEDAASSGENYLFVIDGATGLNGLNLMGESSDARWLAQRTAALLRERLPESSEPLEAILASAMEELRRAWPGPEEELPSAGLVIWRAQGGSVEYFGLGDCDAAVRLRSGKTLSWREKRLAALDAAVLRQMQAFCRETGGSMQQAREALKPQLAANRAKRNTPDGYWCLDPTGRGIAHARRAWLRAQDCESLFACSDGFSQCIGFGLAGDLPALHRLAQAQGLDELKEALFRAQEADEECRVLPRFKFRDDASAALAGL